MDTATEQMEAHKANATKEELDSWVGRPVIYADPVGKKHHGLITACWSVRQDNKPWCVNLVYVSSDPNKTDQYGRQIERHATSVLRYHQGLPHGNWFRVAEIMAEDGV